MRKCALILVGGWLCVLSSVVLAQVCTAGLVDMAFGQAGTGYAQLSPQLSPGSSTATVEGLALDATGGPFALSEAAIDSSGSSIPDLVKLKRIGARELAFGGIGSIVPEQPSAGAGDAVFDIDGAGNLLVGLETGDVSNILVRRYSPAGVLDITYGSSGTATIPLYPVVGPWALRAAADGSVFVANRGLPPLPASQNVVPVVVKLTSSGALDTSFGQGGYSFFYNGFSGPVGKATDLALLANGTILVGGRVGDNQTYNRFYVARLFANGLLDTSFGTSAGMTVVDFGTVLAFGRRLAVQTDGKILLSGGIGLTPFGSVGDGGVIRLNPGGTFDTTFNSTGVMRLVANGGAFDVAVQNNHKILITSAPYVDAAHTLTVASVTRLTATGQLDIAFGAAGTGIVSLPVPGYAQSGASNILYEPGGKILVHVSGSDASGFNIVETLVRLDSGVGAGCH
jgi:uncharacterized delta-60 repeat protein